MKNDRGPIKISLSAYELIDKISSLEDTLKEELIKSIENQMDWARFRYDDGGPDYAERIEFADFYFELSDILKELHKDRVSGIVSLKLAMDRAYSSLRESVYINEQLELF